MTPDGARSASTAPPSRAALAWRPLGYALFTLAWGIIALSVAALWALCLTQLGSPSALTLEADPGGNVLVLALFVLMFAFLALALPATLSEAVFGLILVARALGPLDRDRALSVNVGGARRPLLAPARHTAFSRAVYTVFDLSWTPSLRVALAALVYGVCFTGGLLAGQAPPAVAIGYAVLALTALVFATRMAVREVRARHSRSVDDDGRAARSAQRAARNARKREARRVELLGLRVTNPDAFAAALLVEVDKEVVKRVHHVRRIRRGEKPALDILVGNVIHFMVGTVDDAEVRPLVLRRAREIEPAPRPPRAAK